MHFFPFAIISRSHAVATVYLEMFKETILLIYIYRGCTYNFYSCTNFSLNFCDSADFFFFLKIPIFILYIILISVSIFLHHIQTQNLRVFFDKNLKGISFFFFKFIVNSFMLPPFSSWILSSFFRTSRSCWILIMIYVVPSYDLLEAKISETT